MTAIIRVLVLTFLCLATMAVAWAQSIIGSYSVTSADNGATLAAGGSADYAITAGAPAGYPSPMALTIVNTDLSAAKVLSFSGVASCRLWPGQAVKPRILNGAWQTVCPPHWQLVPGQHVTLNTDPTNGCDTAACDGLATGGRAFKTANYAAYVGLGFEFSGDIAENQITVLMCGGCFDPSAFHFAPHDMMAAQGGAAFMLDCAGGGFTSGSGGIQTYFRSVIRVRECVVPNIAAAKGAYIYMMDSNFIGGGSSADSVISAVDGGVIEFSNNTYVHGNAQDLFHSDMGKIYASAPMTVYFTGSAVYNQAAGAYHGGYVSMSNMYWSVPVGVSVTGFQAVAQMNGIIDGVSAAACALSPTSCVPGMGYQETTGGHVTP